MVEKKKNKHVAMLFLSSVKYLKAQRLKWRASRHHSPSCSVIKEETGPFSQENHCMPLKGTSVLEKNKAIMQRGGGKKKEEESSAGWRSKHIKP